MRTENDFELVGGDSSKFIDLPFRLIVLTLFSW